MFETEPVEVEPGEQPPRLAQPCPYYCDVCCSFSTCSGEFVSVSGGGKGCQFFGLDLIWSVNLPLKKK